MNFKNLYIAFAAILLLGAAPLFGQERITPENRWAGQLNVQHQDILGDISFGQLSVAHDVKIRPFYTLELQRFFNSKKSNKNLFAVAELGYYHNLYHDRWLSLKLGIGSQRQFGNFFVGGRMQGGFSRTQGADIQYVLENDKWIVSQEKRPVTIDVLMSPRIDLGYRVINNEHPIDVFINYQMTLYVSPELQIGLPYYGYGLGVRYGL